ncbi:hypothetical protein KKC59_04590 [bacterium]|nr:hypothetical protein [bacterium]
MKKNKFFFIINGIFLLGILTGFFAFTMPCQYIIIKSNRTANLGKMLNSKQKQEISKLYHSPLNLNKIAWSPNNTYTPFLGSAPTPGQQENVYITKDQFRYNHEIKTPKDKNTFRIFITGGSTAYGVGASTTENTIAGYLEKMLNDQLNKNYKFQVITSANPSWASTHERIMIENKLSELEPDMVISFSGNNDVHWSNQGKNIFFFHTYQENFILNLLNYIYKITGHKKYPSLAKPRTERIGSEIVAKRLEKNILLSSFSLSQKNADYVFILQPTIAVTGKILSAREKGDPNKKVNHILKDRGPLIPKHKEYWKECYTKIDKTLSNTKMANFHYFNLTNIFDKYDESKEIFIDSYHFADVGNEIIAENIFKTITPLILKKIEG